MKFQLSRMTGVTPRMAAAGYVAVEVPKGTRRAAMLLPKPRKRRAFIPALPDRGLEDLAYLTGELGPDERLALRALCLTADLFILEDQAYLLAPVTPELVDTLAAFEAEASDRENDLCDEPQADDEPSFGTGTRFTSELEQDEADKEDNGDQEPDEPDEASLQLAAKVMSLQMVAIGMGHYAPGASYDWEPGGTKAGKL